MHALRRLGGDCDHQVAVEYLGQEGDEGRQKPGQCHQAVIEGVVGGHLVGVAAALPETAAAASHVPVGKVVDERFYTSSGVGGIVVFQLVVYIQDELVQFGDDPAVKLRRLRLCPGCAGDVVIYVGIGYEEGIDVPEREEEAAAEGIKIIDQEVEELVEGDIKLKDEDAPKDVPIKKKTKKLK